ncbi:NUDIX hydrolase [Amnibacterium kyonggiense]|uniref:ADP-ribose pyrophosphatase YjhB (NUDIX family) n=1 Tax=Amnibacterium kyonggiense TaxID=595671 RepID=A0A4R7FMD8_9MICO|nr:NUDIX domain-containing protein [Amnibacterium kyonggiense]TDS77631.1 ADP-ribose pyrophosphatase YjhB (NUDIX family) [Amnibacterium kyonggiense]
MPTPEFILRLRASVGRTPLWLVGATAVVVHEDRLLLVKRADTGEWSPVAGIVEPGEHSADTAEREVWEEARVHAVVERLAAVGVTREYEYPNGDRTRFTDHTYRLRYVSGTPEVGDDESTDAGWFPIDDLPEIPERYLARIRRALAPGTETLLVRDAEA